VLLSVRGLNAPGDPWVCVVCAGAALFGLIGPCSWFQLSRVELLFEAVYAEAEFSMLLEVVVWGPTLPEIWAPILLSVWFFGRSGCFGLIPAF
jgi:hypothetical protein